MRYKLVSHPDMPGRGVTSVSVEVLSGQERAGEYWLEFCVAHSGSLLLPPMLEPGRADGLWKTTCCEVFVAPDDGSDYIEFNLSPSLRWAAYGFDAYRAGMHAADLSFAPAIKIAAETRGCFQIAASIDLSSLRSLNARMNLAAVIEESDGAKSYWALAHAPGPPDFHNPDCFVARLPAPERP